MWMTLEPLVVSRIPHTVSLISIAGLRKFPGTATESRPDATVKK
jgi:hypothetical protein